jgi:hypothetical protein
LAFVANSLRAFVRHKRQSKTAKIAKQDAKFSQRKQFPKHQSQFRQHRYQSQAAPVLSSLASEIQQQRNMLFHVYFVKLVRLARVRVR